MNSRNNNYQCLGRPHQPVYPDDDEPQHVQPHQPAVVRVQPVYISDVEPLQVQPYEPAAQPI